MAQPMTGWLREAIVKHVTEIYFPSDIDEMIWNTLPKIWTDYLDETVGEPPAGAYLPNATIYLVSSNPKIKRFCDEEWNRRSFDGRPAHFPFCLPSDSSLSSLRLNLDSCPISQLKDTITALADMYSEKCAFMTALNSELLKSPSVEAFLKRFPEIKGAMTPWIKDAIEDLPVECVINMDEISFDPV